MRSKTAIGVAVVLFVLFTGCGDNIIQRASSDYFRYHEGNWWQLASDQDTMIVEIETVDTLLHLECFPVSYGGYTEFHVKAPDAILEYACAIYHFNGADHTIVEDFMTRIELPLVAGNSWQDSLVDSLYVSGIWLKARIYYDGRVMGFDNMPEYGDVYEIEINKIKTIITPDSTYSDTIDMNESYAPGTGLIRLDHGNGVYELIDHSVE
jgi:hypothetical protein